MRPRFAPEPQAVMMVLSLPADEATDTLARAARRAGLDIRALAPAEGYAESGWFDLAARRPTGPPFEHLGRIVKLRFFADPVAGHTRLLAECVVRIAWDPSAPERDLERMPPAGHPGRMLLDSVLAAVRPFVVRDTTARDTTVRRP